MGAMASLDYDYTSMRASVARAGRHLEGSIGSSLPLLTFLILLSGIAILVVTGSALGWLAIAFAPVLYMVHMYYAYHIKPLPVSGEGVTGNLAGDVLSRLGPKPTIVDIATVIGQLSSGQFMGARFGLTPSLLNSLATGIQAPVEQLWPLADEIRARNGLTHITGSVLVVAIVRLFPNHETILAQIHLNDDDLDKGIRWQQHLLDLVAHFNTPKRTGGIARDWSFGYIPLLNRFGQNISEQIAAGGGLLVVDVASHREAIGQLIDTFGTSGRQNAVLVGAAGVG